MAFLQRKILRFTPTKIITTNCVSRKQYDTWQHEVGPTGKWQVSQQTVCIKMDTVSLASGPNLSGFVATSHIPTAPIYFPFPSFLLLCLFFAYPTAETTDHTLKY
jgi:hypothetical protein